MNLLWGPPQSITDALRTKISLTRYRSTVMTVTYDQWATHRQQHAPVPVAATA